MNIQLNFAPGLNFSVNIASKDLLKPGASMMATWADRHDLQRNLSFAASHQISSSPVFAFPESKHADNSREFSAEYMAEDLNAMTVRNMIATGQLRIINSISRDLQIDSRETCFDLMKCWPEDLSKQGASTLIGHLRKMSEVSRSLRKVG